MKIEIEINEEKILELAKSNSMDDLPRVILSQAKQEAVISCVNEIKNKLVEKEYYSNKEFLQKEVRDKVFEQISETIEKFVDDRFNETEIKKIIEQKFNSLINEWIDKKIYDRLEEAKANIIFVNENDINENDINNV